MIYTNENRMIVGNAKNIVEANGIEVFLKNEHSQSAVGEIPTTDGWPELWVLDDSDYEKALQVIESSFSKDTDPAWDCSACGESNDASFGACWKCQTPCP